MWDKFRPDWLFEFLHKPKVIRPWLNIRMPNFRFNESEAVSLVKHLGEDMRAPSLPPIRNAPIPLNERTTYIAAGKKLMFQEYFNCWSCHLQGARNPEGPPEVWAPDLMASARRLKPDWILRWIQDPQKLMKGTKMLTFFEDNESGPDDILGGDEAKQIRAIAAYIASLAGNGETGGPGRRELVSFKRQVAPAGAAAERAAAFELAVRRYPKACRARGARLMNEMNCAGCHDVGGVHEKLEAGPPLAHEGSRVKKNWLIAFLKKPFRIRPNGYAAGAHSRMPDFRLSGEEAGAIAGFLMTRVDGRIHSDAKPHGVSKAVAKRGARLFASLRCGACHSIKADRDMRGNSRFRGPDLTKAGRRLQVEHLGYYLAGDVGKTGSKMEMDAHPLIPGMGLFKKQIGDLSAYISTLK
ncbi:MAG: cytochrome c [Nitrospinota bacterium]